ncbi:MAG: heme-binding domain-containing protein [Flavobacteriaceae bacterium]|nr:heme-binding domain-containing protein [Flavobacteriaceae bacterium]
MKKVLKVILAIVIIAFIAIQFTRPAKNAGEEIAANQITAKYQVPQEVQQLLNVSCYDCHSNTTHYPWYSNIQPVAWMLDDHIVEGKDELNFSTFMDYPVWRQYKKFKEIGKEVKDGDMPISSYTLLHRDAVLSADQKVLIQDWVANSMKEMEAQYPANSLAKPK